MLKKYIKKINNPAYMFAFPVVLLIIGLIVILSYRNLIKGYDINYVENSNIDYRVCLKDNNFYENKCVEKGNQYVASLIDYIPANFNYKLDFVNSGIEYAYNYRIIAEFDVFEGDNDKVLYKKEDVLYSSEDITATSGININYNLNIDYNKYNNLLSNFISVYDLNQTKNELKIMMDVKIKNVGENNVDFTPINSSKASSITIPLTTKTVNVDISGTALNTNDSKINVKPEKNYIGVLIIGIIFILCSAVMFVLIKQLIKKTKTIQDIYNERIKKITLSYDSYIQKITGDYPIGASQICKVATFQEMIEIKESSEKPLLMLENQEKTGTFFLIPVGEGVIYTYAIRVVDIESEIKGTKAPDYDKKDILKEQSGKKNYTKEKIKEDIRNTTELEILDDENAIMGTKNSDEDLYEQLGKTSEYNIDSFKKKSKKKSKKKNR